MQPQQGQMVQGFSDPQATGQPTMVGGQYVITVPQQSPAPTWMGVIMIIYGLGMVVLGVIDLAKDMQEGIYMVSQVVSVLVALTIGVGGFSPSRERR